MRRGQVMKLISLGMQETGASDRIDDGPEHEARYAAIDRRRAAALKNSTPAEREAAREALKRHGYT